MYKKILSSVLVLACLCCSVSMHKGISSQEGVLFMSSWLQNGALQEDHMIVSVRALSSQECEKHLKADILKWGYQPVQVTIDNQTPHTYKISPEAIDLPTVESGQVARSVFKDAIARTISFSVLGFIFWPFSIPGTMSSLYTKKKERSIKQVLRIREVRAEKISPYSVVHRMFFIPVEDYSESFTLSLQDTDSLQIHSFQTVKGSQLEPLPVIEENYYLTHAETIQ